MDNILFPKQEKSALGLSIKVGAGVEMMSHRMAIYSVGALWHN